VLSIKYKGHFASAPLSLLFGGRVSEQNQGGGKKQTFLLILDYDTFPRILIPISVLICG